ncbi:hypothetical protein OsI_01584 [Oryza sativa Indica Group]|uniref:Uncharacterized protein n=1 Tax=Oryza sativa subsp. indica TaxID=39946 RepID=B8A6S6_ORYSI|nr:hypothetical protein OsI_01584 [Oryza sativa Indica Group]
MDRVALLGGGGGPATATLEDPRPLEAGSMRIETDCGRRCTSKHWNHHCSVWRLGRARRHRDGKGELEVGDGSEGGGDKRRMDDPIIVNHYRACNSYRFHRQPSSSSTDRLRRCCPILADRHLPVDELESSPATADAGDLGKRD